jgi:RHS repeat-associated protein
MRLSRSISLLLSLFVFSNFALAEEDNDIIFRPPIKYTFDLTVPISEYSADALLAQIKAYYDEKYQECLSTTTSCATVKYTGYKITEGDENKDPENESIRYTLLGTYIHTRNGEVVTTTPRETNGLMDSFPTCPKGVQQYRSGVNGELLCKKKIANTSPPSCPAKFEFGNPIDVATLEKREHEIDFVTGDGLLTLERFYVSQYEGWHFGVPRQLIDYDLPVSYLADPSMIQNSACYRPAQGTSKDANFCFKYVSGGRQLSKVLRGSDGSQLFFRKSGDDFVATNNYSGKFQAYNQNGYSWVYIKPDNSKEFYSVTGLLRERQTAKGRKVFYDYSGSKLTNIHDDSGRNISLSYDDKDRIIGAALPDGNSITYAYDKYNNITKVNWPDGHHKSYLYNETEHTTATDDLSSPLHILTGKINEKGIRNGIYKYGSFGRAVSTEKAVGVEKYEIYSSTSVITPLGPKVSFVFKALSDETRLLRSQSQPAGSGCNASSQYLAYNTDGLITQRKEFNGNLTQYGYNENKLENVRVEGVTTTATTLSDTAVLPYLETNAVLPTGIRKISTEWHPDWRVKTRIAEAKKITTNIYNGQPDPFNSNQILNCAPASVTAPLLCKKVVQATTDVNGAAGFAAVLDSTLAARVWKYTYNELGKTLTVITPQSALTNSVETTYEYYTSDSSDWRKGDLKQISNALGHTTQFTRYDANGRVLEIVDVNGVISQFTYDLRGRLLTSSRGTETTQYQYDPVGNLIRVTQPDGVYLEYDYDNASRLIRIRDARSNQIEYTLDKASNITNISMSGSGGLKYQQQRVYDALSRVQNIINASNNSTTLKYDASGNLTSEIDAKNQTTSQTYDGLDQFKQRTDALSGKINYTFDAQGNLTSVKDPRNNTTSYKYNAFGDLVEQTSPDTGKTTFAYDAAGNRISSTDARGVTQTYVYDALNRLTAIQYPSATENITYRYDGALLPANDSVYAKGQLTSLVMSSMQWDFIYNAQGQLSKKRVQLLNLNSSTEYVYNTAGRVTRVIYPSGRIVNYDYDASGNISSIRTQSNSNATETLVMSNVNYLPFGPAESFTYGNGLTHSQTYDLNYRLTSIQVGGILHRDYVYDAVSNITGITNNVSNTESQTLNYDALNRLTSALGGYGNLIYTYDAVGNRLTESRNSVVDTYSYATTSNRLNSITRSAGNRSFTYDAAGNPTQRTSDDNNTHNNTFNNANRLSNVNVNGSLAATYTYNPLGQRVVKTLANGSKEIYHYDEAGQLLSVTDASGTTQREYIYFGNQQIAMFSNNTLYYIHNDHLNTPQVVTNQSQQVVWMGNYEPFGKLAANQSNSIEIFSRFPGQYFDAETNLYYNYFRDYDPSIGRYIESDPIGLAGGINTYGYVSGNPLKYVDPLGMIQWTGNGVINSAGKYVVLGYGWGTIKLVSECQNGKRIRATYDVEFWPFGAGTPSIDEFDTTIEDYQDAVNPQSLAGDFTYKSLGVNIFGGDLGTSSIRINNNTTGGVGAGLTGTMNGSSTLISAVEENCDCE